DDVVCPGAFERISAAHPDSIFAWIHYSDPRKELIDWGRRKLHYAYLAENWMISIVLGTFLGSLLGIIQLKDQSPLYYHLLGFILVVCVVYGIVRRLNKLREDVNAGGKVYRESGVIVYQLMRKKRPPSCTHFDLSRSAFAAF